MKQNQYSFATWLRTFGVILILLCHFTQQNDNPYVVMSSQFFNIGNSIFFILSGFLFGIKGGIRGPVLLWYKKRLKRIYIPYEMMIITLFIIYLALKIPIQWELWIPQFIGVQGWNVVFGTTQTWFVTAILFCYLCTPVISKIILRLHGSRKRIVLLCVVLLGVPIVTAYILPADIYSILTPVCSYALAFLIGVYFNKIHISGLKSIILFIVMMAGFALRVVCRMYWDDTIFYNQIVANYTHMLGALCIFFIFSYVFKKAPIPAVVSYISEISFEIYLWHYMFVDGPLRLFGVTESWILNCILVFSITFIISAVAKRVERFIILRT